MNIETLRDEVEESEQLPDEIDVFLNVDLGEHVAFDPKDYE